MPKSIRYMYELMIMVVDYVVLFWSDLTDYVFLDGCIYALKRSKKPVAGSIDE